MLFSEAMILVESGEKNFLIITFYVSCLLFVLFFFMVKWLIFKYNFEFKSNPSTTNQEASEQPPAPSSDKSDAEKRKEKLYTALKIVVGFLCVAAVVYIIYKNGSPGVPPQAPPGLPPQIDSPFTSPLTSPKDLQSISPPTNLSPADSPKSPIIPIVEVIQPMVDTAQLISRVQEIKKILQVDARSIGEAAREIIYSYINNTGTIPRARWDLFTEEFNRFARTNFTAVGLHEFLGAFEYYYQPENLNVVDEQRMEMYFKFVRYVMLKPQDQMDLNLPDQLIKSLSHAQLTKAEYLSKIKPILEASNQL